MKRFEGNWKMLRYEDHKRSLMDREKGGKDGVKAPTQFQQKMEEMRRNLRFPGKKAPETLVVLEQSFQLSVNPPGPIAYLVRRISAHICKNLVLDLQHECSSVRAGSPTVHWFAHAN